MQRLCWATGCLNIAMYHLNHIVYLSPDLRSLSQNRNDLNKQQESIIKKTLDTQFSAAIMLCFMGLNDVVVRNRKIHFLAFFLLSNSIFFGVYPMINRFDMISDKQFSPNQQEREQIREFEEDLGSNELIGDNLFYIGACLFCLSF